MLKNLKEKIVAFLYKKKVRNFLRNKYYVSSTLFLLWVLFGYEYSYISHIQNKRHLKEIKSQCEYYKEQIASDSQKLEEINTEKKDLETFAREHYLLAKPDEDVFIVVED